MKKVRLDRKMVRRLPATTKVKAGGQTEDDKKIFSHYFKVEVKG